MPNGTSSTHPTNQKAPQQPGPPADEPKPQKAQQAQQEGAKPFKFDFKPDQEAQQAAPQTNGVQQKPEAPASAENGDGWNDEQQQLLVKALKAIGKEVPDRCCSDSILCFQSQSLSCLHAQLLTLAGKPLPCPGCHLVCVQQQNA